MSKFGRIFWNNYDFIYVSIIFIDSLACDRYIEIRNPAEHFSYSSQKKKRKKKFFFFFFLLETISSMNCQDIKHEMSKPLSGKIFQNVTCWMLIKRKANFVADDFHLF